MTTHFGRHLAAALCAVMAAWPALPAGLAPNGSGDFEAVREEFIAAMQRVRQRQPEPADSPALENFVIYDYLVAARLRRDLAANPAAELDPTIDTFLRSHSGQPVARALRHDWMVSLADRRRWDWFLPRSADLNDPPLICDRLAGRLANGDTEGLGADALARWTTPQKQPDECAPVFVWLRTQGLLSPELAESRTRAALAADNPRLAHDFVVDVPAPRAAALLQWIQLLEAPKPTLGMLATMPTAPVEADALMAGFNKLSSTDVQAATPLLPLLLQRPDLSATQQGRLQRSAALGEAYSRAPGAIAAFSALPEDAVDGQVQEWRVRAALWAEDFAKALAWLEQMPPTLANQPRWRYWHARAVAATASPAAAAPLYAQIAGTRDYYGYLAADRLRQSYNLNIRPSPDDAEAQAALGAEPGLIRAHALFDCDMADDAGAEWGAVFAGARPAVKIQAAHLASRWGWYAQTIATLAQAAEWDDVALRYPRPYATIVADASKETGVAADWLFAIMRQESLFRRDAVSRADARGLMQMQPATAAAVARRWHLSAPSRDSLFDPAIAVKFGALYVRELLDRYNGQLDQSLAAYNAGPVSVARWLPANPLDADIWIENIPYTETRGYVQHILEHIVAFATMRGAEPPRLSTLLPQIDPSGSATPASSGVPTP
jgi:soluble lytic murein transglycosylase